MGDNGMKGECVIKSDERFFEIHVDPGSHENNNKSVALTSLSGGEKSKTLGEYSKIF